MVDVSTTRVDDFDCPITFSRYTVAGPDAPVLVCTSGLRGHTVSRAAIRQIIAGCQREGKPASCPFCMQDLASQDASQLEIDYHVVDNLLQCASSVEHATARDQFVQDTRVIESLRVVLTRALADGSTARFVGGSSVPDTAPVTSWIKSQATETPSAKAAAEFEQTQCAIATLDEHAKHCTLPLLGVAASPDASSTRTVLQQPGRTIGDLTRAEAFRGPGGGLMLPVWLHAGLALARTLRILHARQLSNFLLCPETVCLPHAEPLDPARCLDCAAPEDPLADPAATAGATRFAVYRRPPGGGSAADDAVSTPGHSDEPCDASAAIAATGVLGWALTMLHSWLGRSPFIGMSLQDVEARVHEGVLSDYLNTMVDASGLDLSLRDLLKECLTDSPAKPLTARSLHNQLKTLAPLLCPPDILWDAARRCTGAPAHPAPPRPLPHAHGAEVRPDGVVIAVPVAAVAAGGHPPGAAHADGAAPAAQPPTGGGHIVAGNHRAACGSRTWCRKFWVRLMCVLVVAMVLRWVLVDIVS